MTGHRERWQASAIVAAVVVLVLVVAFASRPAQVASSSATDASALRLLTDVGLYLFLVLTVVVLGVAIWALWPDRLPRGKPRRRPWWQQLLPYVTLVCLCGLAVLVIRNPRVLRRLRQSPLGQLAQNLQKGRALHPSARPVSTGPDWTAIVIVALIVAVAIGLVVWRWLVARRRRRSPRELALDLEGVLEQGILALGPDGPQLLDPRQAVIEAWAGFERVLARAGVPVRPGEAPHEYLTRALIEAALTVDATTLRRFTDLFEWARYSTNPVTEQMRSDATVTLTAVRDGLHHQAVPDLHVVPT
ncbi:MAG: DUF4129 domain-containing protein [Candidatus Dormibacteraceae bacterium]